MRRTDPFGVAGRSGSGDEKQLGAGSADGANEMPLTSVEPCGIAGLEYPAVFAEFEMHLAGEHVQPLLAVVAGMGATIGACGQRHPDDGQAARRGVGHQGGEPHPMGFADDSVGAAQHLAR